ncbi:MAG TPA: DUF2785 domain-containing protein [Bacillales bacterium]|nr:DUF2785 domain-containing protein [Bacillales bacterium]
MEKELKEQLISIRENDYDFSEYDLDDLTDRMMQAIGATDSELRDDLIHTTFGYLITEARLAREQMKQLLNVSLDEAHLFYRIGEKGTDSVFTRSFSVLLVALILYADKEQAFLSEKEVFQAKRDLLSYTAREKDVRGYVEGKGWAHSAAHTADALDELAQSQWMGAGDLKEMLAAIQSKILTAEMVYSHNEDERLALPVMAIFQRELLDESMILDWIGNFQALMEKEQEVLTAQEGMNLRLNVRNFLRSVYFRLRFGKTGTRYQEKIEETLDAIRRF